MSVTSMWARAEPGMRKMIVVVLIGLAILVVTVVGVGIYLLFGDDQTQNSGKEANFNLNISGSGSSASSSGLADATDGSNAPLNIHIVAHSHDDVGWLKTVNQYYDGSFPDIHRACVRCIINSVIDALLMDSSRKFIYVETAYLWRWWKEENYTRRSILKKLVDDGRFEIIGGGWCMNDEAVTHYSSIIDQFTWGFRRLNEMFGENVTPKVGWQIDSFGHSLEQASIFAQMGFDGLFFARIDYEDKAKRKEDKRMEFIWRASTTLGQRSTLFTSTLYEHYTNPKGFCYDVHCRGRDYDIEDYNLQEKAEELLQYARNQSLSYWTSHVMLTMGDDFYYEEAHKWFNNLDKLIKYINEEKGPEIKIFYSTPSIYIKSLNKEKIEWPVETGDFFPYADGPHTFWTGYYTSRPSLKFFERQGNNFLQIVKQLLVLTDERDREELQLFREAMAVMQHHDAVTGTERQHVADDYVATLYRSMKDGERLASAALCKLSRKDGNSRQKFKSCFTLNVSSCVYSSESENFVVTVYNPTSQSVNSYVRIPVQNHIFGVTNHEGTQLITQMVPIPQAILRLPGRDSVADHELVFKAENIPSLGYLSFYISQNISVQSSATKRTSEQIEEKICGNKSLQAKVGEKGQIIIEISDSNPLVINQSFHFYQGSDDRVQKSGAYIFRPKDTFPKPLHSGKRSKIYKGNLVEEIHHELNDWISQVVRIYKDKHYVEFDWLVGPIPVESDLLGKEVITRYSSNLRNEEEFYTDSNGREMMKRKLNHRPTWNSSLYEPVAANYYPITTKISIEDKHKKIRLSVLTDRSQGGSSLNEGEIELMLHRRLPQDDGRGVMEGLNETACGRGLVVRGQHRLIVGSLMEPDETMLREKEIAAELNFRPWIFFTPVNMSYEQWRETHHMTGYGLKKRLPKSVRILTLEPWRNDTVLLRLEHLFEKREASQYSAQVEIDLKDLFPNLEIKDIVETNLGANQNLEDEKRLRWYPDSYQIFENDLSSQRRWIRDKPFKVQLRAMEIRTFIIYLNVTRD
ncbi:hypothetical protein QAD02_011415 [Eretmocerus hayati]|uniref:Uncharacterized protein n=1 Tax=Eretmocerus hayati TaxID=131215 RepID=A0ACC2NX63_9HYME|nr:hypothetical protein QAD02_011415 [Eretmocerus hayati]